MTSELHIGQRVRTPYGDGVIVGRVCHGKSGTCYSISVGDSDEVARVVLWDDDGIEPIPPDIPRERVADLHAAVVKRVEQLDSATCAHWPSADAVFFAHSELSEVAETLRLLLEVDP
jgi:hypothetical protein